MILSLLDQSDLLTLASRRIGPALAFERLWRETGCRAVIEDLAAERGFGFALERACFLTVLHRLMVSGSDRSAEAWREDYRIEGAEDLALHHLYRTMGWLGEEALFPVCSSKLLRGRHALRDPAALRHHVLLHLDDRRDWAKWLEAAGVDGADLARGPVFNQASMAIDAAVDSQGWRSRAPHSPLGTSSRAASHACRLVPRSRCPTPIGSSARGRPQTSRRSPPSRLLVGEAAEDARRLGADVLLK